MSRTFAAWVAPIAEALDADDREMVALARAAPPDVWDRPSAVDGWTNRDVLAHCAGGNDQLLQIALRAAISRKPLGPESFDIDTDAANARGVEERRSWPIERVIAELEASREEMLDLLSQLTDEHRHLRAGGRTLGDLLALVQAERHTHGHLRQLRGVSLRE